jgi:hypothetical protein
MIVTGGGRNSAPESVTIMGRRADFMIAADIPVDSAVNQSRS